LIDKAQRKERFRAAIELFEEAYLSKSGSDDINNGACHFWLGRFRGELCIYDYSMANYQIAKTSIL
jgi:hypothetical protein